MADSRKAEALHKKLIRVMGRKPYLHNLDLTSLTDSSLLAMTQLVNDVEKIIGENNGLRVAIRASR